MAATSACRLLETPNVAGSPACRTHAVCAGAWQQRVRRWPPGGAAPPSPLPALASAVISTRRGATPTSGRPRRTTAPTKVRDFGLSGADRVVGVAAAVAVAAACCGGPASAAARLPACPPGHRPISGQPQPRSVPPGHGGAAARPRHRAAPLPIARRAGLPRAGAALACLAMLSSCPPSLSPPSASFLPRCSLLPPSSRPPSRRVPARRQPRPALPRAAGAGARALHGHPARVRRVWCGSMGLPGNQSLQGCALLPAPQCSPLSLHVGPNLRSWGSASLGGGLLLLKTDGGNPWLEAQRMYARAGGPRARGYAAAAAGGGGRGLIRGEQEAANQTRCDWFKGRGRRGRAARASSSSPASLAAKAAAPPACLVATCALPCAGPPPRARSARTTMWRRHAAAAAAAGA